MVNKAKSKLAHTKRQQKTTLTREGGDCDPPGVRHQRRSVGDLPAADGDHGREETAHRSARVACVPREVAALPSDHPVGVVVPVHEAVATGVHEHGVPVVAPPAAAVVEDVGTVASDGLADALYAAQLEAAERGGLCPME